LSKLTFDVYSFSPPPKSDVVGTLVVHPVFASFEEDARIEGHVFAVVPWTVYFENELAAGTAPVIAVVDSSCGHSFTFEIEGHNATYLGEGDLHDPAYEATSVTSPLADFARSSCHYTVTVYATEEYEVSYLMTCSLCRKVPASKPALTDSFTCIFLPLLNLFDTICPSTGRIYH
jgi:hypothetical protein